MEAPPATPALEAVGRDAEGEGATGEVDEVLASAMEDVAPTPTTASAAGNGTDNAWLRALDEERGERAAKKGRKQL